MDSSDKSNKKTSGQYSLPQTEEWEDWGVEHGIFLEPISLEVMPSKSYSLSYSCLLIPRFPFHQLKGDLAEYISQWLQQICISYGWRLESITVLPDYLQWVLHVSPSIPPNGFIQIIRSETSKLILSNFGHMRREENPFNDFWAPGYLIVLGARSHPKEMIEQYIRLTRQRQGISARDESTNEPEYVFRMLFKPKLTGTSSTEALSPTSVEKGEFLKSNDRQSIGEKYMQVISLSEDLLSNLYQSIQQSVELDKQVIIEIERQLHSSKLFFSDELKMRYINKNKKRKELFSNFIFAEYILLRHLSLFRSAKDYDFASFVESLLKTLDSLKKIDAYENRPAAMNQGPIVDKYDRLAGDTTTDAPLPASDVKKKRKGK